MVVDIFREEVATDPALGVRSTIIYIQIIASLIPISTSILLQLFNEGFAGCC